MAKKRAAAAVQTSDAIEPVKTTRKSVMPITDKADLLERFKDYPAYEVISRRLMDPNDPGSLPILLLDESPHACVNSDHQLKLKPGAATCRVCNKPARKWYVRYVNTNWEGRWANIKAKGYVPVEVKDLQDEQDVADLVETKEKSGQVYVRRGDKGQEILCKIPLELYLYIKRQQRDVLAARNNSKRAMREELAERAGASPREDGTGGLGDEAGQFIHEGGIKIEMMRRSRTTLKAESAADDSIDHD